MTPKSVTTTPDPRRAGGHGMTGQPTAQHTLPGDGAALVVRPADLVEVLTDPELVEIGSLLDAMGRAHGVSWFGGDSDASR